MYAHRFGNGPRAGAGANQSEDHGERHPPRSPVQSAAALGMALLGTVLPALATTLARLDVGQMTAHAAGVIRAQCVAVATRADARGIWTLSTFERHENWKGSLPQRIVVRLPGGEAGGRRETVEAVPRFVPGEEVVLFLEPLSTGEWTITGWALGTYRIRRDGSNGLERAVPDAGGMRVFDQKSGEFRTEPAGALSVAQLRAEVMRLQHRGKP